MVTQFATAAAGTILAHQGGWDEALLIAGPILTVAALLWVAKRRVDANAAAGDSEREPEHTDAG